MILLFELNWRSSPGLHGQASWTSELAETAGRPLFGNTTKLQIWSHSFSTDFLSYIMVLDPMVWASNFDPMVLIPWPALICGPMVWAPIFGPMVLDPIVWAPNFGPMVLIPWSGLISDPIVWAPFFGPMILASTAFWFYGSDPKVWADFWSHGFSERILIPWFENSFFHK